MNIKNYPKLYYVLGVIYLLLIFPGILLFYGSIFLFDDPRTMESILAQSFFLISTTFSVICFVSGVSCLLHKKISVIIGDLWFKFLVALPLIEIFLLIITLVFVGTYCGGEFCI